MRQQFTQNVNFPPFFGKLWMLDIMINYVYLLYLEFLPIFGNWFGWNVNVLMSVSNFFNKAKRTKAYSIQISIIV